MKHLILLMFLCVLASGAYAQRMRDMSLSPEETMREPNITNSNNRFDPYGDKFSPHGEIMPYPKDDPRAPIDPNGLPPQKFMDMYCNPNFTPALSNVQKLSVMHECLRNEREQLCAEFARTPLDAQRVISNAVECFVHLSEAESPDADCNAESAARLQLLRKYAQDKETSHALTFIPEQIAWGSQTNCLPGAARP